MCQENKKQTICFLQGHSTTNQLIKLIEDLRTNSNNKEQTAAISLDVEKAFDRIWHAGLIFKMSQMQVPMRLIKLIVSFLTQRTFSAKIEDETSATRKIETGISQGSCLSPTLFILYTNDIPSQTKLKYLSSQMIRCFIQKNKNA